MLRVPYQVKVEEPGAKRDNPVWLSFQESQSFRFRSDTVCGDIA